MWRWKRVKLEEGFFAFWSEEALSFPTVLLRARADMDFIPDTQWACFRNHTITVSRIETQTSYFWIGNVYLQEKAEKKLQNLFLSYYNCSVNDWVQWRPYCIKKGLPCGRFVSIPGMDFGVNFMLRIFGILSLILCDHDLHWSALNTTHCGFGEGLENNSKLATEINVPGPPKLLASSSL